MVEPREQPNLRRNGAYEPKRSKKSDCGLEIHFEKDYEEFDDGDSQLINNKNSSPFFSSLLCCLPTLWSYRL